MWSPTRSASVGMTSLPGLPARCPARARAVPLRLGAPLVTVAPVVELQITYKAALGAQADCPCASWRGACVTTRAGTDIRPRPRSGLLRRARFVSRRESSRRHRSTRDADSVSPLLAACQARLKRLPNVEWYRGSGSDAPTDGPRRSSRDARSADRSVVRLDEVY